MNNSWEILEILKRPRKTVTELRWLEPEYLFLFLFLRLDIPQVKMKDDFIVNISFLFNSFYFFFIFFYFLFCPMLWDPEVQILHKETLKENVGKIITGQNAFFIQQRDFIKS